MEYGRGKNHTKTRCFTRLNMRYFKSSVLILGCLIFGVLLLSCWNENSKVLPEDYEISKSSSFLGMLYKIHVYEILNNNIDQKTIKNYSLTCELANCAENFNAKTWGRFLDFEPKNQAELIEIISDENFNKRQSELIRLITKIKNRHAENIMISGCYKIKIGEEQKEYNFYERIYIIDVEEKKFYVFDYLEDPF